MRRSSAQPVDGGGHAFHVAAGGQLLVDVGAGRAGQRHLEHARPNRRHFGRLAAAKPQRGVEHPVAALGVLLHQLLRPLKSRVPQDHRQADHVVAVRLVVVRGLGDLRRQLCLRTARFRSHVLTAGRSESPLTPGDTAPVSEETAWRTSVSNDVGP